jgi:hypothetical protein
MPGDKPLTDKEKSRKARIAAIRKRLADQTAGRTAQKENNRGRASGLLKDLQKSFGELGFGAGSLRRAARR